jgi:hypothetical protein
VNSLDRSLRRLLNAAARAPVKNETTDSSFATLRVVTIARWRAASPEEDWLWLTQLFRRALIFSALIMILSLGWSWFHARTKTADASSELAGYALTIQLPP